MDVFQKINQLNHQTLNQYEEKKRIEESTDQTRVADKLRPTAEDVMQNQSIRQNKQSKLQGKAGDAEQESIIPVRDGGYINANTSANPEMILKDLQREVGQE